MVTKPIRTNLPATAEPLKPAPSKIEPPELVAGKAYPANKSRSGPLYRDEKAPPSPPFRLPETVSTKEIQDQSYRYGGGRRAGKASTEQ